MYACTTLLTCSPIKRRFGRPIHLHAAKAVCVGLIGLPLLNACGGTSDSSAPPMQAISLETETSSGQTASHSALSQALTTQPSDSPAALPHTTLTVRARGTLSRRVGPLMSVEVNHRVIGQVEVRHADWTDWHFTAPSVREGDVVAIRYTNDLYANGEDRNLFIQHLKIGSSVLLPTHSQVRYDRFNLDGLDVYPGQSALYGSGALLFPVPPQPSEPEHRVINAQSLKPPAPSALTLNDTPPPTQMLHRSLSVQTSPSPPTRLACPVGLEPLERQVFIHRYGPQPDALPGMGSTSTPSNCPLPPALKQPGTAVYLVNTDQPDMPVTPSRRSRPWPRHILMTQASALTLLSSNSLTHAQNAIRDYSSRTMQQAWDWRIHTTMPYDPALSTEQNTLRQALNAWILANAEGLFDASWDADSWDHLTALE